MNNDNKVILLLKTALEFNTSVVALATQVIAAGKSDPRTVSQQLSILFKNYQDSVAMLIQEEKK